MEDQYISSTGQAKLKQKRSSYPDPAGSIRPSAGRSGPGPGTSWWTMVDDDGGR